ncbi:MAG: hypothetical protein HEQ22_08155 [Sphingopyxis sp.]|uniref:hypothetical protein n=1 Tax=Sphingopyxis sp. TaxID=1908224 RepID=UPI003D811B3A
MGDPIEPFQIEHLIDEIWADDRLQERYNFVDYHFERDGNYCRARSYADDFRSVVLFGPFLERHRLESVHNPGFEADVTRYLERRFAELRRR